MRRRAFLVGLSLVAAASAAVLFLIGPGGAQPKPPPENATPAILKEIESLEKGAEPPPRSGFEAAGTLESLIRRDGHKVIVGTITLDSRVPLKELERLLRLLRAKPVPGDLAPGEGTNPSDAYRALAYLLKSFPETGLPFFHALREEADPQVRETLSRLLKVSMSKALYTELVEILRSGGSPQEQALAARGLEHKPQADATHALYGAWENHADPGVRKACLTSLSSNLATSGMDRTLKVEIQQKLRETARTTDDHARRVDAVALLIESRRGYPDPKDQALLKDLIAQEPDRGKRNELERLAGKIRAGRDRDR
jgi:hypothetical protein